MTWVCDIPGDSAAVSAMHFGLHVSLAAFVVGAGALFLAMAVIAYRRPIVLAQPDRATGAAGNRSAGA